MTRRTRPPSKAEVRRLGAELRAVRSERLAWLTGARLHWGVAWCAGPGSAFHQSPVCEGCATVTYCRDRAAEYEPRIAALATQVAALTARRAQVPVQGLLFDSIPVAPR